MYGRARSAQTNKEPEEAMLIVIAALSLLGAAASLLVPGGVLCACRSASHLRGTPCRFRGCPFDV
jgi:hypothetical protein